MYNMKLQFLNFKKSKDFYKVDIFQISRIKKKNLLII